VSREFSSSEVFKREMSSAILFSWVLIHWELMPSGEFISSEQKNRDNNFPILDFRQALRVQFSAEDLSVTLRRTGYGSLVMLVVLMTWRAAM